MKPKGRVIAALVALLFGALTVLAGGRALFGGAEAQAAVGDAVPFVLWFNFLSGFVYMIAGVGIWRDKTWARGLAALLALAILAVFALFGLYVAKGGAYEMRTVWAMTLRAAVWGASRSIWPGAGRRVRKQDDRHGPPDRQLCLAALPRP